MVTIKTVAKKAGVSTGTVSNVLSGNRPVSDDVRQRVLQAVEELGYQTNLLASSLVTGRSNTIGAVMPGFFFGMGGLLAGIDEGAREMGFSLLLSKMGENEDPIKHLSSLFSRRVDGVIWGIPETHTSHSWLKALKRSSETPIVFALCKSKPRYSSVWMDNFSGGYTATQHLIEHGCAKIGHIGGIQESLEARDRKAGWEKALQEAGLDPVIFCESDWYEESGRACMLSMLENYPDIDAVFVASDYAAFGAITALQKSGRRIPEDVKVIGFDDVTLVEYPIYEYPLLEYTNPPLTSIRQDYFNMGVRAAKELYRRINDPDSQAQEIILPTQLVKRRSCGCEYERG